LINKKASTTSTAPALKRIDFHSLQELVYEEIRTVLMRGGFAESEAGVGAHRELERRAREHSRADEQEARIIASQKETVRLKILSGVLIAFMVALAAVALMR